MKNHLTQKQLIYLLVLNMLLISSPLWAAEKVQLRVATFNIASGLKKAGQLDLKLKTTRDTRLQKVAAIIQKVRPDLLLLNEFDYNPGLDQATLFQKNYLSVSQAGQQTIAYPYHFSSSVNTGLASGLDLNGDGKTNGPADAWGFGFFPGQYGMLVLSRYPLIVEKIRSLQKVRWADMPAALQPLDPESGKPWYPQTVWQKIRLSSKSHWDIPVQIDSQTLHFLVSHPTPPVFDGSEDRNGRRNHDEIRLFADYIDPEKSAWIITDQGSKGGLKKASLFVIAGDQNADPMDGDSSEQAIMQFLHNPLINSSCVPMSAGASEASRLQAGKNLQHKGNPAADTGDFNDRSSGNLRLDYVLPSKQFKLTKCGVFWPMAGEKGAEWIATSDHHLVWVDLTMPAK